jgi:inorganic pyrophosphatase
MSKNHQDPTRLPTFDKDDKDLVNVVVETPRGSRNKFAYEPKLGLFRHKKVLPAGMEFPYDFGFIPSTRAEDGDPLDALLLMDEPAHPGTLMRCRTVGIIEGEQKQEGSDPERNDRVLLVSEYSAQYAHVKDISDLDKKLLKALQNFFVNYHGLDAETFTVLACKGARPARKAIEAAAK